MASKIILVTGANRGIGYAIVQLLAQRAPDATILLGCRDIAKANTAIAQLKDLGLKADFNPLVLDITDDDSIAAAVTSVREQHQRLDVLINNAGIALPLDPSQPSAHRAAWNNTLNTNLTSIALLTTAFLPLLTPSPDPRILNISSARASFTRTTASALPPTANTAYSVSKAALNMLTVDMAAANPGVLVYAVSPGHCSTGLNGFKGKKDAVEGARGVVELVCAERGVFEGGFWECEGEGMGKVGW